MPRPFLAAVPVVVGTFVAACGGGGGPAEAPPPVHAADAPAPEAATPPAGRKALVGATDAPTPTPWAQPLGGPVDEEVGVARVLEPRFEYGRVFEGTQVKARFTVENAGDVPLVVHAVQTACGCTQPELWRVHGTERVAYERGTPIPPRERLEVDVAFDTRRRNGREDKPIFLYANVPGGRIEMELRGEVAPMLVFDPPEVAFGEVVLGRSAVREFGVASADGAPLLVHVEPDAVPAGLEIELAPIDPDAAGRSVRWRGRATIGPAIQSHVLRWPVRLESDRVSQGPAGEVRLGGAMLVAADMLAPIDVSPPHLSLGVVASETLRSEHAIVRVIEGAADVRALTVVVEGEFAGEPLRGVVRARLAPRAESEREAELELVIGPLPTGRPGRIAGRVRIEAPGGSPSAVLGFTGVVTGR